MSDCASKFRALPRGSDRINIDAAGSSGPHAVFTPLLAARQLRNRLAVGPAASAAVSSGDSAKQAFTKDFYRTRLITFAAMFVGYGSYYLTRNSLSYVVPTLLEDRAIAQGGLTMTQIGGLTSVLPVCYGFSKFLSGVMAGEVYCVLPFAVYIPCIMY